MKLLDGSAEVRIGLPSILWVGGVHKLVAVMVQAEHLWSRRKGKKHCQRRERKEHFGELVQLDGLKSK